MNSKVSEFKNVHRPKVLIITYYWPPAGGPGVQRWVKFAKYLPEFGIDPVVYVPQNAQYPIVDSEMLTEVSSDVTILKQNIFEPYQIASFFSRNNTKNISAGIIPKSENLSLMAKVLLWIRGNVFIPDARIFWVKPSIKFLEKYIVQHNIKAIITSGPPHSLHLIGLGLKAKLNIKWIADFRDPWTTIGYQKKLMLTMHSQKIHLKLEKKVLQTADQIIVTSHTTKLEFEKITDKSIHIITNGFDGEIALNMSLDVKFTLAHIGSFLSDRNPQILWQVLSELTNVNIDFANYFQLKLIGKISQEVLDSIAFYGLSEFIDNRGYLSHLEAIIEQQKSQILLLIEIDSPDTICIIPGKLFEYLAANRPIVAIGPKGSDMQAIIENSKAGIFVDYEQKEILKEYIAACFEKYLNQNLLIKANDLEQFSRKNLTKKLANIIQI